MVRGNKTVFYSFLELFETRIARYPHLGIPMRVPNQGTA